MAKINKMRQARLVALENFIRTSEKTTFSDVFHFCSEFGKNIKERMVREDIKLLKSGEHNGVPLNLVVEKRHYRIKAIGDKWRYEDLTEEEKNTLPILFSILKPNLYIPSVNRVMEDLVKSHKLKNDKVRLTSSFYSIKSFSDNAEFVKLISNLMGFIAQQQACEFNYFKVNAESGKDVLPDLVEVYPLQIRVYDQRYYLVAVRIDADWEPQSIQTFPLDRFHKYLADPSVDQESGEIMTFDWETLSKAVGLSHYFEHCIGLFRNYETDTKPQIVYRWFQGWAASHVEAVPLHKSQQIVQRTGNQIRVRLEVYNNEELAGVFRRYGNDCWE